MLAFFGEILLHEEMSKGERKLLDKVSFLKINNCFKFTFKNFFQTSQSIKNYTEICIFPLYKSLTEAKGQTGLCCGSSFNN